VRPGAWSVGVRRPTHRRASDICPGQHCAPPAGADGARVASCGRRQIARTFSACGPF
jgi:hypothetical protein